MKMRLHYFRRNDEKPPNEWTYLHDGRNNQSTHSLNNDHGPNNGIVSAKEAM